MSLIGRAVRRFAVGSFCALLSNRHPSILLDQLMFGLVVLSANLGSFGRILCSSTYSVPVKSRDASLLSNDSRHECKVQ